jgi:hypothetical protein
MNHAHCVIADTLQSENTFNLVRGRDVTECKTVQQGPVFCGDMVKWCLIMHTEASLDYFVLTELH